MQKEEQFLQLEIFCHMPSSSLQFYMYEVTDNDTFIEDAGFVKTTGSQLPALSKAAFDTSMNEKQETEIFIWGGLDLMRLRPIDDLILLRCTKHKDKLKVKIFPSAQIAEIDFKNPLFKNVAVQSGTIPAARFGHTLTQIQESFMLAGGLSMPNVTKESFDSSTKLLPHIFMIILLCCLLFINMIPGRHVWVAFS